MPSIKNRLLWMLCLVSSVLSVNVGASLPNPPVLVAVLALEVDGVAPSKAKVAKILLTQALNDTGYFQTFDQAGTWRVLAKQYRLQEANVMLNTAKALKRLHRVEGFVFGKIIADGGDVFITLGLVMASGEMKTVNVDFSSPQLNTVQLRYYLPQLVAKFQRSLIPKLKSKPKPKLKPKSKPKSKSKILTTQLIDKQKIVATPQQYRLTIRSNVRGDHVRINGMAYGETRIDALLKPGQYRINITKPGYVPYEKILQFKQPYVLRARLTKIPKKVTPSAPTQLRVLTILSNVVDNMVTIDGKAYGSTRVNVELTLGKHTIQLEKVGYLPYEQVLEVSSSQEVYVVMRPMPNVAVKTLKPKKDKTKVWRDPKLGIEFLWVPKGCFDMGSPSEEVGRYDDEKRHAMCLDNGFWMGKYEITNAQYKQYKRDYRVKQKQGGSLTYDQPAVNLNWSDAVAFAAWLSEKTGQSFRLPTEVEWEYAARGGTQTAHPWGDEVESMCVYANVADISAKDEGLKVLECNDHHLKAASVGQYKPNPYGLYDMLGNVWEWTCSAYSATYDGSEVACMDEDTMVTRGGSWSSEARFVRSANRYGVARNSRYNVLGFRLIKPEIRAEQ